MSLYRYVAAKDELLALMVDAALAETPAAPAPGEDWRDGLSRWAWAYHDALRRHPWVLRMPISGAAGRRRTRSPGSRTAWPRCATRGLSGAARSSR